MPKVILSVYIEDYQHAYLKKRAEETGRTFSVIVREIIERDIVARNAEREAPPKRITRTK